MNEKYELADKIREYAKSKGYEDFGFGDIDTGPVMFVHGKPYDIDAKPSDCDFYLSIKERLLIMSLIAPKFRVEVSEGVIGLIEKRKLYFKSNAEDLPEGKMSLDFVKSADRVYESVTKALVKQRSKTIEEEICKCVV